jgi:hypothetical protein
MQKGGDIEILNRQLGMPGKELCSKNCSFYKNPSNQKKAFSEIGESFFSKHY